MTVQSEIKTVIAYCEAIYGNYSLMSNSTEDKQAKDMFNTMKSDIDRHIQFLNNRLEYLNSSNQLNQNN